MRVSNVSFILSKKENPEYSSIFDDNDDTYVKITAGTKNVVIKLEFSDRAEDESARLQRWFNSCDYLEVVYADGDPVVKFHSDKPLDGYSEEFLTKHGGFFAETFLGGRFFDYKLLDPEQG